MRRPMKLWLMLAALSLGLPGGCGEAPPPTPYELPAPAPAEKPESVVWSFAPNAIRVFVDATLDVNSINNEPHAVSLCLYQAATREALVQQAATPAGLLRLLDCKATAPEAVFATHLYVQPGSQSIFLLDRAKDAQFLAVVAGFNNMTPADSFAIVPVPIHAERKRSWYLLTSSFLYSAAKMDAKVFLNNQKVELQGAEGVF